MGVADEDAIVGSLNDHVRVSEEARATGRSMGSPKSFSLDLKFHNTGHQPRKTRQFGDFSPWPFSSAVAMQPPQPGRDSERTPPGLRLALWLRGRRVLA